MSKECKKKEKGITLTGLVITIIVLIILAGISLSYFIQEGIIDKAEEAGERMNQAAGEEAEGLKNLSNEMEGLISGVVIPEGAISIGEVEWEEGKASVEVSTDTGYEIEWQKEGEESWSKVENGGKIEGLEHGDIIFIRLTDGTYVGEESTVKIEDKTAPTVSITGGSSSSSITVQVEAEDKETGMEENPTYTYYYKVSGQPDSSYKQANQGTSTTCTINGLTQGTKYTVKVEVADKAGNKGAGTVDITTETVTSGTVEGAITFSTATWRNGTASITISTNTSYTIEWQIGDAEEGSWTTGTSVTGLHHGDIVFARLTDGRNVGQEATTKIEDKTAPTVSISETGKTSNSISVRAQATDKESGMASSPTYTYYYKVSGQPDSSYKQANQGTSTTCTINGLTQGTKYTVKVEVADNAGNVGSGTVDITTATVTSGTVEGAIQFSPATWSNGTASITISTNTSYTIEWQIGDAEEGNWTRGTSVTGLHHGDIVFARLTDGRNVGQEATTKIEDKTAPTVSISETGKTSNSISVRAQATDKESGMASSPTYTYYYKVSGQPDSSYKQANQGTSTTCTINGLTQGTKYTVKVEVADNAGNVGSGTVDITTATVTSGTVEGAIQFSPATWSNGTASITISTNTSYTIEWQIGDAEEGSWTTGTSVTGLHHGDIVFARLTDGRNVGQEATTKIEDKTAPTVSISETGKTSNSISVRAQATDKESGMASSPTYTYYYKVSGQPDSSYKQANQGTSTTCTINGLTQGTKYTVKVEVADNAGNVGSGTVDITTATVTSGTVEGAIQFSPATWSNGTASITISTNTSYTIEWQIGDAEEGNWTRGTSVTGLHHGDIVFARLTDGRNVGQEATTKIEDKTAPTVSISETGKTSNSISVRAQATDKESGMASSPTYTYYYKVSGQPDSSYKQANQGTSTTCTINGLTQGTKYTVKVEVADNAGNVGSGTVDITTATVTSGTVEGAIQFSPATWSNGTASITISTNTSYTIEWQKGNITEGQWTTGTSVTGLNHGDIVFARLTDGINAGQEASVKIEDKTAPTISAFIVTATTSNSITVQVTANDAQTGIASYAYKKNSEGYVTGTGNTYTFSGLAGSTTYTLGVKVTDKAGNDIEKTVTGTTKEDIPHVSDITTPVTGGNKVVVDDLGNKVKIPNGFKVIEGTKVEEGIVIQDNIGNQFVWVPVGNVKKSDGSTVNITLGRYTFNSSGTPSSPYSASQKINSSYIEVNGSGSTGKTSYGNVGPININDFQNKTKAAGGYYIARYEASYRSGSLNGGNVDTFVPYSKVSTNTRGDQYDREDGDLFSYVKQSSAAYACRNMYKGNSYFTSDLTNSFAWDTALVFIQKCSSKTRYSVQSASVKTLKNTGTTTDQVCHIYDMCGNLKEWTTETATGLDDYSCVPRGDSYAQGGSNNSTSKRAGARTNADDFNYGFRPILYLN